MSLFYKLGTKAHTSGDRSMAGSTLSLLSPSPGLYLLFQAAFQQCAGASFALECVFQGMDF